MFSINLQSRQPICDQLYTQVGKMISLGVLKPGEKLPTVRELALSLGINPNTASKAYKLLERDGIICTVIGKGSFVSNTTALLDEKKKIVFREIEKTLNSAISIGISVSELENEIREYLRKVREGSIGNDTD